MCYKGTPTVAKANVGEKEKPREEGESRNVNEAEAICECFDVTTLTPLQKD